MTYKCPICYDDFDSIDERNTHVDRWHFPDESDLQKLLERADYAEKIKREDFSLS